MNTNPDKCFKGLFTEIGRNRFQHHRLVILSLGLLNAALLISAAVIGIYCKYENLYCALLLSYKIPELISKLIGGY